MKTIKILFILFLFIYRIQECHAQQYNTKYGNFALNQNTNGIENTAVGYASTEHNTIGGSNTAIGAFSLDSNVSGSGNIALGGFALLSNKTGQFNTSVGLTSMYENDNGSLNTATGYECLYNNRSSYNTGFGALSLFSNTTGSYNTAIGYNSLRYNNTSYYNTAVGYQSLCYNTAEGNVAVGYNALYTNTTGYNNTAIGTDALHSNDAGYYNVANGHEALYSNTSGFDNVASGTFALYSNTIGHSNTAIGAGAMNLNNSGYQNNAIGTNTMHNNTSGHDNNATGYEALFSNTIGYQNTANGSSALYSNTSGISNTANGFDALYYDTSYSNTAIGAYALQSNISGRYNSALGVNAGISYKSNIECTFIGAYSGASKDNISNAIAIGWQAKVDSSNKVRIGNSAIVSIGGQVNWTTFSDGRIKKNIKENVPGLTFINLLRPVTYYYDISKENEMLGIQEKDDDKNAYASIEKINFTGLIAQEVDKAAQKINYDFSGVDKSGSLMGLRYSEFVVPLVKAVQELSKMNNAKDSLISVLQNQNTAQQIQIDNLQKQINDIRTAIAFNQSSAISQPSILSSFASLSQNIPNPFNGATIINYVLPQTYSSAKIIVTNKSGNTIKQVDISGSGKGSVKIDASTLVSGTYQYSLYVNNKLIDTKQMILNK